MIATAVSPPVVGPDRESPRAGAGGVVHAVTDGDGRDVRGVPGWVGILGVVVTFSGAARTRLGWRSAAYWIVWALLLAGVFALHVLADHDAVGVRHATLAAPAATAAAEAAPSVDLAGATVSPATTAPVRVAGDGFATALADHDGADEACILFLAGGVWVLVLLMVRVVKRRGGSPACGEPHPWHSWRIPVPAPPGLSASSEPLALRL